METFLNIFFSPSLAQIKKMQLDVDIEPTLRFPGKKTCKQFGRKIFQHVIPQTEVECTCSVMQCTLRMLAVYFQPTFSVHCSYTETILPRGRAHIT